MASVAGCSIAWTKPLANATACTPANEDEAKQIVEAKNNSERQPVLNLQIAKAYLAGSDNGMTTRTWQNAIEALMNTKQGPNLTAGGQPRRTRRWPRCCRRSSLKPEAKPS